MRIRRNSPGMALVLVLAFLVIITALTVAFFASVTTELRASRNFGSLVSARQLADSAVSVVEGQIRDATTQGIDSAGKGNYAWGSQPGMIRVFGSGGAVSSNPYAYYKLYSSNNMVVNSTSNPSTSTWTPASDLPPAGTSWQTQTALYTDLNAPARVTDPATQATQQVFPIMDGNNLGTFTNPHGTTASTYLNSANAQLVEGFEVNTSDTHLAYSSSNPVSAANNPVAMPVSWLYVLKDGTITWPSGVGPTPTSATWSGPGAGPAPTKANPIVGRIAFWADDDSSKVNINTAAGSAVGASSIPSGYTELSFAGSYWDTPRFNTYFDKGNTDPNTGELLDPSGGGLAACQPAQGEFQRYPGHPATTSLGMIFKNLLTSEQIYHLVPRIQFDDHVNNQKTATSQGGTYRLRRYDDTNQNNPPPNTSENNLYAVQIKRDRLYASVDELLYASFNIASATNPISPENGQYGVRQRYTNDSVVVQNNPQPKIDPNGTITPALVNRLHFFLSANNRAPELNLFGQPRVAIWPVYGATSYTDEAINGDDLVTNRNAYDRQIAFCSTVGGTVSTTTNHLKNGRRYMFTRNKPLDTTYDINLPRNLNILTYLKNMTSAARGIPGFGSPSFENKYKIVTPVSPTYAGLTNRDLILAEMFDYIRCANMKDTTSVNGTNANTNFYAPTGTIAPSRANLFGNWTDANNATPNAGLAAGVGRYSTISEATLVFYCSGMDRTGTVAAPVVKNRYVRAFLVLSTFDPLQGYAPISDPSTKSELQVFDVTGLDALQISPGGAGSYTSLGFPATAQNKVYYSSASAWGGRNFGGYEGFMHTLFRGPASATPAPDTQYRLQSGPVPYSQPYNAHDLDIPTPATVTWKGVPIPGNITTIDFKGGPVTLKLSLGAQASGTPQLLQTITLNFPNGTGWPVPRPWYRAGSDWASFVPPAGAYTAPGNAFWFKVNDGTKPAGGTPTRWEAALSYDTRFQWAGQTAPGSGSNGDGDQYSAPGVLYDHEGNRSYELIQPGDVARSLVFGSTKGVNPSSGFDLRLAAVSPIITQPASQTPASQTAATPGFYQHPDWNTSRRFATTLRRADGALMANFPAGSTYSDYETGDPINHPVYPAFTEVTQLGNHVKLGANQFISQGQTIGVPYSGWSGGALSLGSQGGVNGVVRSIDLGPGDFDNGIGIFPDGPFCNKEDEGNVVYEYYDTWAQVWHYPVAYYTWSYQVPGNTFYTPNRQLPSPVMFGSLPSRPGDGRSWETLCFCPNPAATSASAGFVHPGKDAAPNDELFLDLFNMPQIEPYSISEPFSTAGKVNLNYNIAPFSYITRNSALRAALQSLRITAVPKTDYNLYKNSNNSPNASANYRLPLDRDQTILGFDNFLSTNDAAGYPNFFRSGAQICERFLYPKYLPDGTSATNFGFSTPENNSTSKIYSFWNSYALTGDNEREKPYCDLYSRVTTKSNTYTVHYRVQPLVQRIRTNASDYATWDDATDSIAGESRGSTTIERTLDANDPRFTSTAPNFIDPDLVSLEPYYRFRVLSNQKFAP